MKSQINWNNKIIEIQIIISLVRVSEHFSKMFVLSRVFNTRILDTTNYTNQDYMHVNYTLIVVYSTLVTGSQSKYVSCFCLDMAQYRSLIGQSLCNAIYWSNMGFSIYWCSRWNGRIESRVGLDRRKPLWMILFSQGGKLSVKSTDRESGLMWSQCHPLWLLLSLSLRNPFLLICWFSWTNIYGRKTSNFYCES
jgi:hypothetical protein